MLRKVALVFLGSLLSLALTMLVFTVAIKSVVGSSDNIKKILATSGIYADLPEQIYKDAQQKSTSTQTSQILERAEIQSAFTKILTPKLLQGITEKSIDIFYDSLDRGKGLSLTISLEDVRQSFASSAKQIVMTRLQSLPTCKSIPNSTDPFTATCKPSGINIESETQKIVDELLASNEFLANPVINLEDLINDGSDQSAKDTFNNISNSYKFIKRAPWILVAISIALGLAIIFVAPTKIYGLKNIAYNLFMSGTALLISAVLISMSSRWTKSFINGNGLPDAIYNVIDSISANLRNNLYIYGGVYVALAISCLIAIKLIRHKKLDQNKSFS